MTYPLYQPQFPGFPFWVYQVPVPHLESFFSIWVATPEPEAMGEAIATDARAVRAMIELNIVVVFVVWLCTIWVDSKKRLVRSLYTFHFHFNRTVN